MPGAPLLDLAKSVYYISDFHKKQILIASHHSVLVLFVGRNLFTYHNSNKKLLLIMFMTKVVYVLLKLC